MKNLSGKCADLNALFVGLARASGLPARDLYGLRVAPSSQFPSLGRAGGNVTTAQHCRAEVWADGYGWIPVDPADVRKLMLEEKKPSLGDPYVAKAREALFGSWEMNWIAFNDAHDVALPGSAGKPLPFLMYPQAEVGGTRLDSLDPEHVQIHRSPRARCDRRHQLSLDHLRGPPNYGCDFGRNKWNSHAGVTAHLDEVRADFEGDGCGRLRSRALVRVHRWSRRRRVERERRAGRHRRSIHRRHGRGGRHRRCNRRAVVPGADRLCVARRSRRGGPRSNRRRFIDRVLDPFLDRYGAHDAIHSFDVINEPDWWPELADRDTLRGRSSARARGAHSLAIARARHARRRPRAVRARVGRSRVRSRLRPGAFVSGRALSGSRRHACSDEPRRASG